MNHLHFAWEIFFRMFADFFGHCRIVCISKYVFFLISCRNLLFYRSKNYLYILDKATLLFNFNCNIHFIQTHRCCCENMR